MLKPVLIPSRAEVIASKKPGRIERRSEWTKLVDGNAPIGPCTLEILTCTKSDKPAGLVTDHGHAWIRLWRNAQDYVSVGFYPDESTRIDPEDRPGLRMPGMLLTPDKYDRIDWPRRSTRFPISADQYLDLIAWIERLQARRDEGSLAFDLVDRNCVGFIVHTARRCGISVEADQPLLGFLPLPLAPPVLTRLTRPLRAATYTIGLAMFGGFARVTTQFVRTQNGKDRRQIAGIRPIYSNWRDLFRSVPFNHVRALQAWQDAQAGGVTAPEPQLRLSESHT